MLVVMMLVVTALPVMVKVMVKDVPRRDPLRFGCCRAPLVSSEPPTPTPPPPPRCSFVDGASGLLTAALPRDRGSSRLGHCWALCSLPGLGEHSGLAGGPAGDVRGPQVHPPCPLTPLQTAERPSGLCQQPLHSERGVSQPWNQTLSHGSPSPSGPTGTASPTGSPRRRAHRPSPGARRSLSEKRQCFVFLKYLPPRSLQLSGLAHSAKGALHTIRACADAGGSPLINGGGPQLEACVYFSCLEPGLGSPQLLKRKARNDVSSSTRGRVSQENAGALTSVEGSWGGGRAAREGWPCWDLPPRHVPLAAGSAWSPWA